MYGIEEVEEIFERKASLSVVQMDREQCDNTCHFQYIADNKNSHGGDIPQHRTAAKYIEQYDDTYAEGIIICS